MATTSEHVSPPAQYSGPGAGSAISYSHQPLFILADLHLPKGKSVLTVRILTEGMMHLATVDFKKVRWSRGPLVHAMNGLAEGEDSGEFAQF